MYKCWVFSGFGFNLIHAGVITKKYLAKNTIIYYVVVQTLNKAHRRLKHHVVVLNH